MSSTIFYHNFSKGLANITEEDVVADQMADGNLFMYSRSGDATLNFITDAQVKEMAEKWANNIIEEYKEDNDFIGVATAYSQLGMVHDSNSKFRQYALPILDKHFKTK